MSTITSAEASALAGALPQSGVAPRKNRKRALILIAALIGAAALTAYGAHWYTDGRFIESTDDAYVGGDVTAISTRVAGYIAEVAVTDNQVVRAGEVIMRLDDRDFRAALAKAEGAVAAQRALIANLEATNHLQDAIISQTRATVAAADADRVRARDDQERYQSLSARSAVSIQSAQKADAEYKQAQANSQKAGASVTAAQRQLDVIASQKQQAEAALAQALAERDIARLNLDYTVIRAPIDGSVGNRRARVGGYAQIGAQQLAVVPIHGLWVDANLKEGQLAHVRSGAPATVEADVLPGHKFAGRVVSVAPATGSQFSVLPAENATGNFTKIVQRVPVRIALDEADPATRLLRPGLSVLVEVDGRAAKSPQP
ncbi:MAG: Membrane fusion component of tripartite multidrug resistance system [Betaproteobacteria bacterium]|nr:Membrane fusion component of tripartite multidrug resistance system [Betaproteobacteria bacterium]